MTDVFEKFMPYSHIDKTGQRRLNKDVTDKMKQEARKLDKLYYERTGRHKMIVDYYEQEENC